MRVQLSRFVLLCSGWQKQCYVAGRPRRAFWLDEIWFDLLADVVFCQVNPTRSNTYTRVPDPCLSSADRGVCVSSALAVASPFQVTGNMAPVRHARRGPCQMQTSHTAITVAAHHLSCYDTQPLHIISLLFTFLSRQPMKKHASALDDAKVPSVPSQTWTMGHYQSD